MQNEHSPLPWMFEKDNEGDSLIRDASGKALMCDAQYYPWVTVQDFPFIVEACNNYANLQSLNRELVEALRAEHVLVCDDAIGGWEGYHKGPCSVCLVLARAEGREEK